jgi:hypothetical protein
MPLKSISLANYLKDISEYTGLTKSLYCPDRDSHALVSAQSCFLPVPPKQPPAVYFGATPQVQDPTKFYVNIFNYQSTANESAVLAIVATSKGTSAQLLLSSYGSVYAGQKLYFNSNGSKHAFLAQRLTYDRILRGEKDLTKPMTAEEKQNNAIVVIQVPLKRISNQPSGSLFSSAFGSSTLSTPIPSAATFGSGADEDPFIKYYQGIPTFSSPSATITPYQPQTQKISGTSYNQPKVDDGAYSPFGVASASSKKPPTAFFGFGATQNATHQPLQPMKSPFIYKKPSVDVENAIISLAESEGLFPSLAGKAVERDERYPVRVTIQWYKVTSSGKVSTEVVDEIHQQMQTAKSQADFWGSLVVDKPSWIKQNKRPTEPKLSPPFPKGIVGRHPEVFCDVCNVLFQDNEIRYRCMYCPDWDVCQRCFSSHNHPSKHLLAAVTDSTSPDVQRNVRMANRTNLIHNLQCSTCHTSIVGARYVCSVCNEGVPGKATINLCDSCADNSNHADNRHPLIRVWYSEDLKQIGLE